MIDDIAARSLASGLKISQSKTKSMRTSGQMKLPITLNGVPIEEVQNVKYLGSLINPKGKALKEIQIPISAAQVVFIQFWKCHWLRNKISLRTKHRIYKHWSSLHFFMVAKCGPSELEKLMTLTSSTILKLFQYENFFSFFFCVCAVALVISLFMIIIIVNCLPAMYVFPV